MENEGGVDVESSRPKQKSCLHTTDERVVCDFQTSQPVVAVNIEDGGASRAVGQVGETQPFNPNASQDPMLLELNDREGGVRDVPQDIPLTATFRPRIRSKVASAGRDLKLKVSCQMRGDEDIKDAEILMNPPRNRRLSKNQVGQN